MTRTIQPHCIRKPQNPVAKSFAPSNSEPYRVKDGDDWASIGLSQGQGMKPWELIRFNFPTLPVDVRQAALEVNWYLLNYVGCVKLAADGKNYCFSSAANPGLIHVPKKETVSYARFHQVIAYMYAEMIRNAASPEVAEIREMNDGKVASGFPIITGEPGERAARAGFVLGQKAAALMKWRNLVRSRPKNADPKNPKLGKWDHKPDLRQILRPTGAEDLHFPIEGDPDHEWYYDIWSNIHYGFVGRAAGFSAWELQTGAKMGGAAGTNDGVDEITVQIGVDLWDSYGNNLTKQQLHQKILSQRGAVLSVQGTNDYKEAQKQGKDPNFQHVISTTDGK
jgi:hypothetical protein